MRQVICIKSGCDVTDKQCGRVIQPLLGGGCQTGLTKRLEIEPKPDSVASENQPIRLQMKRISVNTALREIKG